LTWFGAASSRSSKKKELQNGATLITFVLA